jgi:4-amino-4-deoxy-L-arabinose transferase-like glycosyltransferase
LFIGNAFVHIWQQDALYHVLIAKSILLGRGYVVYPPQAGESIHHAGEPALFKAPLYQYFLAGVFALSDFSFKLYFPLQSLIGGVVAGFVGLIALRAFRNLRAAWFAGILAAAHPILVNSASKPYNENLFFFFFVVSIWAFLVWMENLQFRWATLSGVMLGLCALTRESGTILLIGFGIALAVSKLTRLACLKGFALIVAVATAVIAPWTIHNYVRWKVFVPIASIAAANFVDGNNECIAGESAFVPYWAERPCAQQDEELRTQLLRQPFNLPKAVRIDRACQEIAKKFVLEHPLLYIRLAFRRLWTALLPFNPRGGQRWPERVALSIFWVMVFPLGLAVTVRTLRTPIEPAHILVATLILLNVAAIAAVLYWSDLRYRVGVDLLLACLAATKWEQILSSSSHEHVCASSI